jgi:long-chain acyl-CoA synthetase
VPWATLLAAPPDPDVVRPLSKSKWMRAACLFVLIRACRLLLGLVIRIRTSGAEQIPTSAFLLAPNHQSYLDGLFLAATLPFHAFRRIFFVGASEYFETPLRRWLADAVNIVPVDPDANLVSAMQAGAAGLRLGKMLVLFPEGERSIDGTIKPFRKGAAILSSHLGVPVVPVAIAGLYELWPRSRPFNWRALAPWARAPVSIRYGQPLRVDPGEYADGTAAIRAAVTRMF